MAKFLILQSPTKSNVGTITERSDEFYKPTFYKIEENELDAYKAMNDHAKKAFIAEKLEVQMGTPTENKKKVVPIVERVGSQVELVLDETPETTEEPLNEPINEVVETTKPKGRPKKVNQ